MNKTIEVLKAARELIATPDKWVQGMHSVDRTNGARCYCVFGAVDSVKHQNYSENSPEWKALKSACFGTTPIAFNDAPTTTHADVLALFDRAIANLESGST